MIFRSGTSLRSGLFFRSVATPNGVATALYVCGPGGTRVLPFRSEESTARW